MHGAATTLQTEPLKQTGKHFLGLGEFALCIAVFGRIDHVQVTQKEREAPKFAGGTHRHMQELAKCGAPATPTTVLRGFTC